MSLLSFDKCQENERQQNLWQNLVKVHRTHVCYWATQDILCFLRTGIDLALSVSSLRVQVSAFNWVPWARHSLVCLFLRGAVICRIQRKPRCPKWDLPLVLDFLSEAGKESTRLSSIGKLYLKSAFLMAIPSAKRSSWL